MVVQPQTGDHPGNGRQYRISMGTLMSSAFVMYVVRLLLATSALLMVSALLVQHWQ